MDLACACRHRIADAREPRPGRPQACSTRLTDAVYIQIGDRRTISGLSPWRDAVGQTMTPAPLTTMFSPAMLMLIPTLDRRLHACSFSPPLVDSFALITRTGAGLSRPMLDFIERVKHHFEQMMTPSAP
jgi:hypothetical protein